ncbi:MAG: DNA polymerase III subunit gamma/tau [Oceanospirillaceae bacterium]|nr:DNA polymerase III subunit gamma/tau [Oceanospirillaceae bacterium]
MSYQVLARKWRPTQFDEMVGQGHVLKALVNALDDNRLHHAYLFTGTRGVGKTSIARLFAKALNCEQGITSKPCDKCSACEEIAQGRFVDLIEVDAASRTKVEDTRELLENVQYAPSRGRFKVYLIDEVHMLSKSSFNALLKTLEEPPPHVKFLLATTDPQKLPVTVLSRCLQFNLKNMIPQRIVEHLAKVLTAEQITFDQEALWLLARSADGSMRDALSLTDQSIAFGAGSVCETDVRVMLGSIDLQLVFQILDSLVQGDGVALLNYVDELAQFSPDYNTVLGDIISLLHRIAIAQTVPAALDNSLGDKLQVETLAAKLTAEDVQLFYQIALMGRKDLPFVPDAREGLEMTLMRMLAFRPAQSTHIEPVTLQASNVASSTQNPSPLPSTAQLQQPEAVSAPPLASHNSSVERVVSDEQAAVAVEPAVVVQPAVLPITQSLANDATHAGQTGAPIMAPKLVSRAVDTNAQYLPVAEPTTDALETKLKLVPAPPASQPSRLELVDQVPAEDVSQAAPKSIEKSSAIQELELPATQQAEQKARSVTQLAVGKERGNAPVSAEATTTAKQSSNQQVVDAEGAVQKTQLRSPRSDLRQPEVNNSAVDAPPWDEDDQQDSTVALKRSVTVEQQSSTSNSSQINISKMLDAPVADIHHLGLDDWPALVGAIGFTGMTAHIAENLSLESIAGNTLQFNVSKLQKNVLDQTQENRIQTLLSQYFDCEIQVNYQSEKSSRETPWQCFEKLRAKRLKQAIASFQGDEMVRQLVSVFSGEVERSSIMPLD